MLPIRSIVLALCATAAIAAPFTDSACPTGGDCPTCFGRQTPDLREIVCNAESAYIVATGVDTDGKNWMSPRRWQDIFGVHGSRYAIEHFPIDERHWDQKPNATCRTYYAKPAYEITSGQAPRRVESPEVAAFKMSSQCSCAGLIAEAGYAVVAFKNRAVSHSDELATQQLNKDVIVVPLPRGEFKIPSCGSKFTEDKSTISTEKLPAVFANDETQLECDKVTSCPKCEFLQHPEQLKDICKSSKELMIVKQTLSREAVRDSNAPWHMPKIEVYVDKDSSSQDSYEIRTKITSRAEKGCAKPTLRVLAALTENVEGALTLNNMQLGEQCQCDFLRHDHGFALIRSERELHKKDELSDKETIIMLPRGQYVLPQCSRDDETPRDETDDHKKAQCGQPEESCPVCKPDMTKEELEEVLEADNAVILRLQTTKYFKKSDQSDDVRCAAAEIISVLKGEKKIADSQLSLALPEKCRCDAMLGFGAQFYAVVKRDAIQSGQSLEKLPLNDQVTIFGYNYLSRELVQKIVKGDNSDEAEDRSGYDGYSSYASYPAPSYGYSAPSYGYSAPSYSAPSYGYSAPSYSAPSYGYSAPSYSAPSYGYSAPSYSAPSYGYSAPSYSAPSYGYSAPSYSAPSYSAPSYGYSAPSYSAPSYGYSAPSYSAPSYGYSAPSYSAPSYGYSAPSYSAPSYGYSAPSYSAPSYGYSAPSYSAPSYSAPSYGYSAPSYSAPSYGYSAPSYSAPSYGYSAPSYSAPSYGYSAPSYSAPSYGYSAPSYSAPSYGYSAPSYSAPSYGYSAPSYSAPSYGYSAPSYSAPSYGYSAPSYSAPSYSAPSYSAPSYGYSAPSYSAPSYGYSAPSYSAPSYSAPSYGYSAPSYSAPSYSAPSYGYSAPSYSAPSYGYSAPSYSAPSYGYSAPSYSAPSYGYSAPSYSAPSYGYSAPSYDSGYGGDSYSAPSYSAPSYSAPSYSAPSYSAPSYSAPSYSAPSYSAPSYSAPSYSAPSYSAPSYGY